MLVVIAEKEEYKLVEELGYDKYPVIITGVGGLNVIQSLKEIPRWTRIINIGYVGSKELPIGTKVLIDDVKTFHDVDFKEQALHCQFIDYSGADKMLNCYTSTDFVKKTSILEPCVFDMELAFIRAMFDNVSAIKVVSDNLSYKKYKKTIEGK